MSRRKERSPSASALAALSMDFIGFITSFLKTNPEKDRATMEMPRTVMIVFHRMKVDAIAVNLFERNSVND